jgi:hypothetical protein
LMTEEAMSRCRRPVFVANCVISTTCILK